MKGSKLATVSGEDKTPWVHEIQPAFPTRFFKNSYSTHPVWNPLFKEIPKMHLNVQVLVWLGIEDTFHHVAVFPHIFGFCMGRFEATGLYDKQINPLTPKDISLPDETQARQGQEDYIFAAHVVLVLWINKRFWQAELFIWLLSYSKFISSHFSRRQDTKIER